MAAPQSNAGWTSCDVSHPPPLGLDELAYLAGGADALGASALVGLCEQGAVHAGRERRVVADDLGPDLAATAAQCALYDELVHVGGVQVRYAGELLKNTRTLKVIRHTLAAHELVPGDRLRACNRLGALNFALLASRVSCGLAPACTAIIRSNTSSC